MMWVKRVLCVLAFVYARAQAGEDDSRTVTTEQGPVKGYREGELFIFYNIPYASIPTGKNRFKSPLPAPVWMSPLEAVDRKIICPQDPNFLQGASKFTIQEDCFIVNVYVPDTEEKNLPVVFYVHGGGYQMGFGNMITPKFMVRSKKIIFVNFNYRLGVHGFLCLGTPDAPGNAGMKDMVAALRWVHRNIAKFGGNPNDITIQGSSAGSSAVDLLLLSKTTRGLFRRAIPESGANVATWSVQIDPIANAKIFAKEHNLENLDIYALEEFYQTASFEMLTERAFLRTENKDNNFLFVPCVERDAGVEQFLDDSPINILKNGHNKKVPMLYGFSNMEGLLRITHNYNTFKDGMNKKFSDYLPSDLRFKNEEEKEKVAREIKTFYFGDREIGPNTILGYINYHTDILFAYPVLRSLKLQVEAGNDEIYLYLFSYPLGEPPFPEGAKHVAGANHCAQTTAVFDGDFFGNDPTEVDISDDHRRIKNMTRQLWLNFMTSGTPVPSGSDFPEWPTANAIGAPYMDISLIPQLRRELMPDRMHFWDVIYEHYYIAPKPPSEPPLKQTGV